MKKSGMHKDELFLIGISHKTAPVEVRECLSFTGDALVSALSDINGMSGVRECVVLSTCNRTEIYAVIGGQVQDIRVRIENYILNTSGRDGSFLEYFYTRSGTGVIDHLFRVICGFDSMIYGESQIFVQVKTAFAAACNNECTGPVINRLFHQAFQVFKQVKTSCSVNGEGALSTSAAAVELAKKTYGSLHDRTVLLVGAGKIGRMCAKLLLDSGIEKLYLSNRTARRAEDLVEELSGEAVPFEKIDEMFGKVDIVITSVSASKPLITKDRLMESEGFRDGSTVTFIDLGVPRNIDPAITDIGNVVLFNIDSLKEMNGEINADNETSEEKSEKIIHSKIREFDSWIREREIIPEILSLRERCERIRTEELEKIRFKVSPEVFETIDFVTRRIVRKILHNPTVTLRSSESGETRERLLESIKDLFTETHARPALNPSPFNFYKKAEGSR